MVNGLYLYSAFLVIATTQSAFTLQYLIYPVTHIHTLMAVLATTQGANLLISFGDLTIRTIHTPLIQQQREQFGVKCLAQGHVDTWTGGARNQTTNLPISGQPLPLLSHSCPKERKGSGVG